MKRALILLQIFFVVGSLFAQYDGKNSGVEASKQPRTPAPDGKLNFQTDLFTGRFGYGVPIQLAPGRNASEPKMSLQYNSAGDNTWCGWGWELDLGFIQRETKRGVPVKWGAVTAQQQYDDAKGFVFSLNGQSASLVNVGGNAFRAEIEGGFLKFTQVTNSATNYWLVVDKSGNKYFFGQSTSSRMTNTKAGWPADWRSTFRWALSRIETVNGDVTTVAYTNVAGALYPLSLAYNGHTSGLTATHTVDFQLEDRTDRKLSFMPGYRVEQTKRLTNIVHKISGNQVRRYQLAYTNSASTLRSLLRSVTMYGANNTSSLPPVTFNYSGMAFQFESAANWTNVYLPDFTGAYQTPFFTGPYGLIADLVDMDGDGRPDRLWMSNSAPWTNWWVQPNTGSGFGAAIPWKNVSSQGQTSDQNWSFINTKYTRFLDINGDGYPDRVEDNYPAVGTGTANTRYTNFMVELGTGSNFASTVSFGGIVPNDPGAANGSFCAIENTTYVKMIDMNGDGLPDRVMTGWQLANSRPWTNYWVQFNTGSGFGPTNMFGPFFAQGKTNVYEWCAVDSQFLRLIDINGDGLADRVMPRANAANNYDTGPTYTNFVVEFNNGYGFEAATNWLGVDPQYNQPAQNGCAASTTAQYCSFVDNSYVALIDMNGDGLLDRVMQAFCFPMTNFMVQLNTGTGFAPVRNFGPYLSQGQSNDIVFTGVQGAATAMLDIDGDGLVDRVERVYSPTGTENYFVVELNKGAFPDLLTLASNGMGGSLSVNYAPSTDWDNRESTNNVNSRKLLPHVLYTVASVTEADGIYPTNTTTYSYHGGMWSASRREFAGFSSVKVTDPLGDASVHFFHQGGGRDNAAFGEYQDNTNNFAKRGIPYRVETLGTNGQPYKLELSKVEEVTLSGGQHFAFVSQSIALDYPGSASAYRATAQQFLYDQSNGNLTNTIRFGEVSSVTVSSQSFTDTPNTDSVYDFTTFAVLSNTNIVDKPQRTVVTDDAAGVNILRETLFDYDGSTGDLLMQRARICAGSYSTNQFAYDVYGNRTNWINEAGVTNGTAYDTTFQTFPLLDVAAGTFTTVKQFDPASGEIVYAKDAKGLVTSNSFDTFFRHTNTLISTTSNGVPSVWVRRHDYGLGGMSNGVSRNFVRTRVNDDVDFANGHENWSYFDGFGRLIQTRDEAEANGFRVIDTALDQRGNIRFVGYPVLASGTNYVVPTGTKSGTARDYDPIGRIIKVTPGADGKFSSTGRITNAVATAGDTGSPVGPFTTAYNDGNDPWTLLRIDAESKTNKFVLDAFGRTNRIIEVTAAGNFTTWFAFNDVGDLLAITNHAGNVIEYSYNDLGQVIAMADPDMGVWEYRRDFAGRIREQVDAKTNVIRFTYNDPLGRLASKQVYDPQGSYAYGVTNIYDSSDDANFVVAPTQLYATIDSEGWEKNGYDVRGRVVRTARYLFKNGRTYTNEFVYDDANRVRTNIYPASGPTIRNTYDTGGNLSEVRRIDGTNNVALYQAQGFDELGHLTGINFGNGASTVYSFYTVSKRLSAISTSRGTNLQSLTYTYDKVANTKSITDGGPYSGSASATLTGIQYDDLHRLVSQTHGTFGTKTYRYSAIGNTTVNGEAGVGSYDYGTRMPHAVKSANGRNYVYDANGNMVGRGPQRLYYDSENRLIVLNTSNTVVTFGYAASGDRLWKSSTNGLQVWIGNTYEERNSNVLFHVLAAGIRVCTFDSTGTNVFDYYHADHLHSTSVVTDKSGGRVQHHEYTPYGRDRYTQSSAAFPISRRFTGQVLDEETGLYFYGARYYDQELARFVQPDTLLPDLSNPQSLNRYAYALNNPLKYIDPTGHESMSVAQRIGEIYGNVIIGFGDVVNPIPAQLRPEVSPATSDVGNLARGLGRGFGAGVSIGEMVLGGGVEVGGIGLDLTGVGAVIGVPANVAGAAMMTHGGLGVNNFVVRMTGDSKKGGSHGNEGNSSGKGSGNGEKAGRSGKQQRLRELGDDPNVSSGDRGWIKNEKRQIEQGNRETIRNPPGKELAHERGREAAKGYDYKHSNLQDKALHRTQHKFDDFGRSNKERPVKNE